MNEIYIFIHTDCTSRNTRESDERETYAGICKSCVRKDNCIKLQIGVVDNSLKYKRSVTDTISLLEYKYSTRHPRIP